MNNTDLGASKPVPQPEYKPRPLQHPTVIACRHKLDTLRLPVHANCDHCWDAWFEANAQHLGHVHDALMAGGTKGLVSVYGAKFAKEFGRYLRNQLLQQYAKPAEVGLEVPSIDAQGRLQ